jgi:DNA-binding NarL/FixJ family response regulator
MKSDRLSTSGTNPDKIRVLLVDDIPQVLQDMRVFLELAGGLEVIGEASNGQEAVHLAYHLKPDTVVMDLEMPIMDGFEATRQIKAQHPGIRVVILSVHAGMEEKEIARLAGADAIVIKGASYEVLMDAIACKLSGHEKKGKKHEYPEDPKTCH